MTKTASHLTNSLQEAIAAARSQSMDLLAQELMAALLKENYQLDEFLEGLAGYTDKKPGWEQVTRYLELASEEFSKLKR
jgi:hypothetical protein